MPRDDFSWRLKETLAKRVAMLCSNPECRRLTSGPRSDATKTINIGVAAHIAAASPGGPRYVGSLSASERASLSNAIWLCQTCAKLVDSDETRFSSRVLRRWKKAAERATRQSIESGQRFTALGKSSDSPSRQKVKRAQELARAGKRSDAITAMTEALALARDERNEEQEVEILLGLALLSSDRHHRRDMQHYFQQAEKKFRKVKGAATKAIYFRAKAAALVERRDMLGAEKAYKDALAVCITENEDRKGNLATQGCIVRSSLVHFLCNEQRYDDALPILQECEAYARSHPGEEETELLQAALEAGIHFCLDTNDEDGAVTRIAELESAATTQSLASRIGGDLINVANRASYRKMHRAAMSAATASIRLGHRCDDKDSGSFLAGALYTEAHVLLNAGQEEAALTKAQAVLDICRRPEDAFVKQAANHLIAEVRRTTGDSQAAVDFAREALAIAGGGPEEVAFAKSALARALNDNGQTGEALREATEAWSLVEHTDIPAKMALEFLQQITNYGSQIGDKSTVSHALAEIAALPNEDEELKEEKARAVARAEANAKLRERIIEVVALPLPNASHAERNAYKSLQEANAAVIKPLLEFWNEAPECAAGAYDFWGRGNLVRLLHNARRFATGSFNVTLEVRTLDDVKRAIRLWGLYADFLILLWKGESQNGLTIIPFPEDFAAPGGWGYMVCYGDVLRKEGSSKKWHPAMAHVSTIPEEVAAFLSTEARPFIERGRLIVLPAPAVGCVNPGHGPFEQLLAEAANAVPSVRWKGFQGVPIGLVPYAPDAPLKMLADLAESEADQLRKLRLLLIQRSKQFRPDEQIELEAKALSLEIDDLLHDFTDKTSAFARRQGLERATEPLAGATAPFRVDAKPMLKQTIESPFAPLFVLQSLGYGWRVDSSAIPKPPRRFEPEEGDVIGTWLAPPSAGWAIPMIRAAGDAKNI